MNFDIVNGCFEFIGSIAIWRNVLQLYKDKHYRGIHIAPTAFFMLWGFWNLAFYPHLDQWVSFWGGVSIVFANTVWVLQMMYYGWMERQGYKWEPPYQDHEIPFITLPGYWRLK